MEDVCTKCDHNRSSHNPDFQSGGISKCSECDCDGFSSEEKTNSNSSFDEKKFDDKVFG